MKPTSCGVAGCTSECSIIVNAATYCTRHGRAAAEDSFKGRVVEEVDLSTERVDWGRHALRIGIDPKSFNCIDTSPRDWTQLTFDEMVFLHESLSTIVNGYPEKMTPGIRALLEWVKAASSWGVKNGAGRDR